MAKLAMTSTKKNIIGNTIRTAGWAQDQAAGALGMLIPPAGAAIELSATATKAVGQVVNGNLKEAANNIAEGTLRTAAIGAGGAAIIGAADTVSFLTSGKTATKRAVNAAQDTLVPPLKTPPVAKTDAKGVKGPTPAA